MSLSETIPEWVIVINVWKFKYQFPDFPAQLTGIYKDRIDIMNVVKYLKINISYNTIFSFQF